MRGLVVKVGGTWLVMPVSHVGEVLDAPAPTRLPGDVPGLEGVVALRGTVLPLWRTDLLLDLAAGSAPAVCVRLRSGRVHVGLLVDHVHGLATIPEERVLSEEWWADGTVHLDIADAAETAAVVDVEAVIARSGQVAR